MAVGTFSPRQSVSSHFLLKFFASKPIYYKKKDIPSDLYFHIFAKIIDIFAVSSRISLSTAVEVVKRCSLKFRVPEPIRQADIRSREWLRLS